jgi:hypothetical protein
MPEGSGLTTDRWAEQHCRFAVDRLGQGLGIVVWMDGIAEPHPGQPLDCRR